MSYGELHKQVLAVKPEGEVREKLKLDSRRRGIKQFEGYDLETGYIRDRCGAKQ